MKFEDYHTHNSLCRHATGTLQDYLNKALEYDLGLIGFSDHFPYDYLCDFVPEFETIPYQEYSMRLSEVDGYISELKKLKKKLKDRIQIKIGFELDYFENQEKNTINALNSYLNDLDYIYGSVHILPTKTGLFAFDDSRFLQKYNEFENIDEIYLKYYDTLQKMINSTTFVCDIISHFDLPKKFNKPFINQDLIMNKVSETLELAKKKNLVIEINSSGLRKEVHEQYPSKEILKIMYELDIPVILGSDAHHPDELAYEFKSIITLLREIGYNYLAHFDKRKRSFIEIS